jgi:hypothetical protein
LPQVTIHATDTDLCAGDQLTLSGSGASYYNWSGGVIDGAAFVPSTSAVYSVMGTDQLGCKNSATVQINMHPLPLVMISTNSSGIICQGDVVVMAASGASQYNWSTGDTGPVLQVTPASTTNYAVTGTDQNGCTGVASFLVMVDACTGLKQLSDNFRISVFPNPAGENFNIETSEAAELIITSALGQILFKKKIPGGKTKIEMTQQPDGVYFIHLKQGDVVKTIKLVKE